MARRRKLEKFADLLAFENVFECVDIGSPFLQKSAFEQVDLRGKWNTEVFQNPNPICLELACGRGEYALSLAQALPTKNYIGVDIKGARIWQGAKKGLALNLPNLVFLRTRIEWIDRYFEVGEIQEIWITFPDPFPAKENRRLTSPQFIRRYHKIMGGQGKIHLKTDDAAFFEYTVAVLQELEFTEIQNRLDNVYTGVARDDLTEIQTHYEKMHLEEGRTIKYLQFGWRN